MTTDKKKKLHKLQEKYISLLPDKLDELNKVWLEALHNKNPEALRDLRRLAHNMAGSAGTFGFPAVSIETRNLEETLARVSDENILSNDTQEIVADSIQRIVNLVELGPEKTETQIPAEYEDHKPETEFDQLIYVIEDNELLANEIASQLQYYDYDVKTFSVIADAMKAVKQHIPSAMIIDIQLPEGNLAGPEFAMLFNEFSSTRVPSIFISARDDWQARLATVRAHGSAYLTKPIDFNELLERLSLLTTRHEPEPFKILIVDDMEVLAEHYAIVLRDAGMNVEIISNIDNMLELLSDFKPELILMDIFMPQCSGLEAASIIRQKDELLSVPIVFLSTESDPLQHLSAMELGGDDFLQKPVVDERLVIAVRTRAKRFRNLRSHMHRDGLTGLLNHVTIKNHLTAEIARAQRKNEALCFAMLDIDKFKLVNDTYGHPVGDRVIKSVSRMLMKRLRKSDLVGRYGGEEFAIILPETNIQTANKLLDNVRQNFSQIVQQHESAKFNCSLSIGVTQLNTGQDLNNLINTADDALYEAKNSGRNKVCVK